MIERKIKPQTIEAYIEAAPEEVQDRLYQLHTCIRAAASGAKEEIKWSMPAYSYKRILVTFAVFKNHIGFYALPSGNEEFKTELSKYKTGKGSIQFPLDKPIPYDLIRRIVRFRLEEISK